MLVQPVLASASEGVLSKMKSRARLLLWSTIGMVAASGAVLVWAQRHGWRYQRLDGLTANVALAFVGDDTQYALGFSERAFEAIRPGMVQSEVITLLGNPLYRVWQYPTVTVGPSRCCTVVLEGNGVRVVRSELLDVLAGGASELVVKQHGRPSEEWWVYADRSEKVRKADYNYRRRALIFRAERVTDAEHEVNID